MHCAASDIVYTKGHAPAAMKNLNTYGTLPKDFQFYIAIHMYANSAPSGDPDLYPYPMDWTGFKSVVVIVSQSCEYVNLFIDL